MTYEEMEKSLQALRDTLVLHERASNERMDRDGGEWRERMGHLEKSLQELRDAQLVHVRLMDRNEQEWDEFRAAKARLFDRMDRIIERMERENGQK